MNPHKLDVAHLLKILPGSVYWKDREGRYLGCNDYMSQMAGFNSSLEIIGKTDYEMPWREQADALVAIDQTVMRKGMEQNIKEIARRADGILATYLTTKIPLKDNQGDIIGILGMSMEIAKEIEQQEKMHIQEQGRLTKLYLENILANLPEPVYWIDRNGAALGCNQAEIELWGLQSQEEVIGKTVYDLGSRLGWDIEMINTLRKNDQEIMTKGKAKVLEETITNKDGTLKTYLSHKAPLFDEHKNIIGIIGTSVDITERKKMEQELKESKEQLRLSEIYLKNILTNLPEPIYWTDLNSCIQGCNNAEAKLFGFSEAGEMIGKNIHDLMNILGLDRKNADVLRENDKKIMQMRVGQILEEQGLSPDGVLRTFLTHKAPLLDEHKHVIGMIGTSIDITARRQMEEELKESKIETQEQLRLSEIYLKNILANFPEPIYWMDRNGAVLGCNQAEADLCGLQSQEEVIGKTVYELGQPLGWDIEMTNALRKNDREIMDSCEGKLVEEAVTGKDGTLKTYLSHKAPLFDENKNVIGIIGTSVDITKQKRIEEELRWAKEAAEASDQAKSEFIVNMSHDVKTPLSGIIGLSEVLSPRIKNAESLEMIKMIHNGGKQLLNFFENCLEMAKLESGDLTLTNQHFNLRDLLEELTELFLPSIENKGLELNVHCDDYLKIYGSHAGLYRILLNLLGNAIKFTKQGSVTIKVAMGEKSLMNEKIDVIISIADTGIGIPEDKISTIFDRFSRVIPSYRGTYEGHGIGLYIVKKFVSTMGGTIKVESEINKGTCFTVSLPFSMTSTLKKSTSSQKLRKTKKISTPVTKSKKEIKQSETSTKALELLLVEDNLMAQKIAQSLLAQLGYQVEVAASGEQVLENFKPGKYNLIFMDIGLPDMEGTDVTQRLRELEKGSEYHVPIVALSAHAVKSIKDKCLQVGMDDVLSKPLSAEKAAQVLKKYIKDGKKMNKKSSETQKAQGSAELAIISDDANKQMLDLFMQSLPESKADIEAAYQAGNIELLIKAVHKLHGALCYTKTPQLQEAVETMEVTLKKGETDKADTLYQHVKKAFAAFEKEYRNL